MMVEWLVYALVVSALVGVAGWLAEGGARAQAWPTRWVWAGAMATSVAVPVIAWLSPAPEAAAPFAAAAGAYVLETLPSLGGGPVDGGGPALSTLVLAGWLGVSVVLLSLVTLLSLRLRLRGRSWPRRLVDGVEVLVSRSIGPAAMGVLRGRVVVPEWALGLAPPQRRLLVLHEAEHVRARDPLLAMAALLLCALAPWNLPLWWQLRRLRLAVEMDCDARVLRRSSDPRSYGALLLAVGRRKTNLALTLALAESSTMLERRIEMIVRTKRGKATLRAITLAGVSGLVLAVACETPGPTDAADATGPDGSLAGESRAAGTEEGRGVDVVLGMGDASCATVVVDGDRSSLAAVREMDTETIERIEVVKGGALPEAMKEEGSCGLVSVSTKGASSAPASRYKQVGTAEGARIPLMREEAEAASARRQAEVEGARDAAGAQQKGVAAAPTFTPMTQPPQLRNASETSRKLQRLYPPLLRDAGIGGSTNVWFFIDEKGAVAKTQVNRTSGHEALDQAALAVAREMEFAPALNGEEPVAVWVALDIAFEVQ